MILIDTWAATAFHCIPVVGGRLAHFFTSVVVPKLGPSRDRLLHILLGLSRRRSDG